MTISDVIIWQGAACVVLLVLLFVRKRMERWRRRQQSNRPRNRGE